MLVTGPLAPSVAHTAGVSVAKAGVISTEVLVIGTGAGGAVAGTELAKGGKKVLFLEAGGAFDQRDFRKRSLSWATTHMFAGRGAQAATGDPVMVVTSGRVVGGSTVLNSGICFKPPPERLREWVELSGSDLWAPENFNAVVDEIWTRIGVAPTHAGIGRRNNQLFLDGIRKLGIDAHFMDRNAPGCVGCGVCHLGCPSGGKASVDKSFLPEALNAGATILTRARAQSIIVEGGRTTGVNAVVVDEIDERPIGTLTIKADVVVVAGSALGSPLILQNSGLGGSECGQHLSLHPGFGVFGDFPEPVVMWDGVPQGAWAPCPDDDRALLEVANVGAGELFALFGRAGDLSSVQRLAHLAMAGAMIRDTGGGSVVVDDGDTDHLRPKLSVKLSERDLQAMRAGGKTIVRAYFAAGAKRVCPGVVGNRFCETEREASAVVDELTEPSRLAQAYASHPHGTCRMGPKDGPNKGVVDAAGCVHGAPGLYVMDGSIFPSTLGINPQVTIMAAALLLARRLLK
ncbi:MAG: GMC family oxidoreductase [Deltaproteobacteria bacterium]|nr:GMC family oxidoreductase [Deltaproteobacteria bacterium]